MKAPLKPRQIRNTVLLNRENHTRSSMDFVTFPLNEAKYKDSCLYWISNSLQDLPSDTMVEYIGTASKRGRFKRYLYAHEHFTYNNLTLPRQIYNWFAIINKTGEGGFENVQYWGANETALIKKQAITNQGKRLNSRSYPTLKKSHRVSKKKVFWATRINQRRIR